MKTRIIAVSLAVAAIAAVGQYRHKSNPLTLSGTTILADNPPGPCPPHCRPKPPSKPPVK